VIFNRTHADVDARIAEEQIGSALVEQLSRAVTSTATDTQAQEWLVKNFLAHQTLAQGETIRFTQFAEQLSSTTPLIRVPVFPEFPGDFRGLINLASHLFPTTAPPKPRRKHKDK